MSPDRAAGLLFVIAGPSGVGKSSLARGLVERVPGMEVSVSHTTRALRAGEQDGREYHFVDAAAFRRLADAGRMLETARVFGHWYGTSGDWVEERRRRGSDVLLEIDWQGARQVRTKGVGAITVHVLPPSVEALEHRLRARGQDEEASIARRMEGARRELSQYRDFDYLVVNERFPDALAELAAIVRAERARTPVRARRMGAFLADLTSDRPGRTRPAREGDPGG